MEERTVLLDIKEGIATITLNRPKAMNSINDILVKDLTDTLLQVQKDEEVKVIVLTGSGKAFCAGGDLFYILSLTEVNDARNFISAAGNVTSLLMNIEKPVIAMVNGVAAGAGFNLALACDIVFCEKTVRFGQSFANVGLIPDCGGMYLLPRVIGMHKAKELMFTADLITSDVAEKYGIVNHVLEGKEQLEEAVYNFATRMAKGAPIALGTMKKVLSKSDNLDLQTVLELEADLQTICMQTQDHKEGVAAFKEKRAPEFQGK